MSYDTWKLRSPDDEYQDLAPYCEHDEYEIDVCMGRAECQICGERWWVTKEEVDAQCERIADYDAWCRKQERREFWQRITYPIRWPIFRLLQIILPRKSASVLTDDEIPF